MTIELTTDTLLVHSSHMATSKKRLNISLSPEMEKIIKLSAKRDSVPEATKAAELLKLALEIEEDAAFSMVIKDRLATPKDKYVSHTEAWKHLK